MVNNTLEYVGSDKILLYDNNYVQKLHPMVSLDFGAIAKGYAVDKISIYLENFRKHKMLC